MFNIKVLYSFFTKSDKRVIKKKFVSKAQGTVGKYNSFNMKLCFEADVYRFGSKRIAPEFYDPRSTTPHVSSSSTWQYITFCILVRIQMIGT